MCAPGNARRVAGWGDSAWQRTGVGARAWWQLGGPRAAARVGDSARRHGRGGRRAGHGGRAYAKGGMCAQGDPAGVWDGEGVRARGGEGPCR